MSSILSRRRFLTASTAALGAGLIAPAWYRRNFQFFGAPVGLIFCIDRQLGLPQWADIGSYV